MDGFIGIGELDVIHNVPKEIESFSRSNRALRTSLILLGVFCIIGIGVSIKLYNDRKLKSNDYEQFVH
jgi:hypothetical protein